MNRRIYRQLGATLVVLSLTVSAALAGGEQDKSPASTEAPPVNLIKVPMTRQATNYTCGVSALQSLFAYYGDEYREDVLARELKADKRTGTRYKRIAKLAKSKGYTVDVHTNMSIKQLQGLLDKRIPVICLIQAWSDRKVDYSADWQDGHYVVAIGYDDHNIYFMDPSTLGNYTYIPVDEFLKRWHDTDTKEKLVHFGMVVRKEEPSYRTDEVKKLE